MKFVYTVWFRDPRLPADDQDYEWPACFTVEAASVAEAATWGDRIASTYSVQRGQQMLSSSVEPFESAQLPGKQELPVIPYGREPSDDEIGW
jgi:hypothetical protein